MSRPSLFQHPRSQGDFCSAFTAVSLNVNGLRSALRKGLLEWLERENPEVVLLQEVRAPAMPEVFAPLEYSSLWLPAEKAGYSGVAMLSKSHILQPVAGDFHSLALSEGRAITAISGGVRLVSVYLPSGSSGEARQAVKNEMLPRFDAWLRDLPRDLPLLAGGDYNIAHQEIDLKNWRSNRNNSGFLPHEREWMTAHLGGGLVDLHREFLGEKSEYTWWSNRGQAYANDTGWRIDYLISRGLRADWVRVDRPARLSDHAPLVARLRSAM